jgi:hypothetical protein
MKALKSFIKENGIKKKKRIKRRKADQLSIW